MESIKVVAKFLGGLRRYVVDHNSGMGVHVKLSEGNTIQDLVRTLGLKENEARLFFINGLSSILFHGLNDSAEGSIFIQVSGG